MCAEWAWQAACVSSVPRFVYNPSLQWSTEGSLPNASHSTRRIKHTIYINKYVTRPEMSLAVTVNFCLCSEEHNNIYVGNIRYGTLLNQEH